MIQSDTSTYEQVKKRRARHQNSHHGCLTCKQRRIKCDELSPICARCRSSRRECIPDPRNIRRTRLDGGPSATNIPAESTASRAYAATCLQCFMTIAIPAFNRCEPSPLWAYMVQDLENNSSSTRAAAIAIGHEHLQARLCTIEAAEQGDIFYSEAVRSLRQRIEETQQEDGGTGKLSAIVFQCLLLVILQCFRRSFSELNIHLQHGLRIASQVDAAEASSVTLPFKECWRLLKHYSIAVALFNPLLTQDGNTSAFDTAVNTLGRSEDEDKRQGPQVPSADDQDIENDEQDLILDLFRTTISWRQPRLDLSTHGGLKFARSLKESSSSLAIVPILRARHSSLEAAIERWSKTDTRPTSTARQKMAHARCMLLGVYLRCRWSGFACNYDLEYHTFARIMDIMEDVLQQQGTDGQIFSPGMLIIAPLFYVALMCRQADIRRRAIKLLREAPQQEGPWDARLVEAVARTIMEYEERLAHALGPAFALTGYIPESCRVAYYYYHADHQLHGGQQDLLRLFRRVDGTTDDYQHEDIQLQSITRGVQ